MVMNACNAEGHVARRFASFNVHAANGWLGERKKKGLSIHEYEKYMNGTLLYL